MKNIEQIKALVDFLEHLFLIQDPDIERKYEEYKREMGGVSKMTVDEIRKLHYTQKGIEKGIEVAIEKMLLKGMNAETISSILDVDINTVKKVRDIAH